MKAIARIGEHRAPFLKENTGQRTNVSKHHETFVRWPVFSFKNGARCSPMRAMAFILYPAIRLTALHSRTEIRQMKRNSGSSHSKRARRIEAKEPHSGLVLGGDIGSDI